jgi:hypothetical protein
VFLGISTSAAKNIGHLGTEGKEIVSIDLKLVLHLKLLALERGVDSVCQRQRICNLGGSLLSC